jgi:hypothetical protein
MAGAIATARKNATTESNTKATAAQVIIRKVNSPFLTLSPFILQYHPAFVSTSRLIAVSSSAVSPSLRNSRINGLKLRYFKWSFRSINL